MIPLLEQLRAKAKAATQERPVLLVDGFGVSVKGGGTFKAWAGDAPVEYVAAESVTDNEIVLKLLDALEVMREALRKVAVPKSYATDGSDTKEEYEELYDFWHMASSEKLDIAKKALNRAKEILG